MRLNRGIEKDSALFSSVAKFDEQVATQTCCKTLNAALRRLANNKKELLLVLERPDVPLHNNDSERDVREYVKKRKNNGGDSAF